MRKLTFVAAFGAALAACGDAAEEPDDEAIAATPAAIETDASSAGAYEITLADGTVRTSVLNPDGTYTDTQDGEVVDTGSWEDTEDGKVCFHHRGPDGTEALSRCYTVGAAAKDGTFVATPDQGPPLTIRKIG